MPSEYIDSWGDFLNLTASRVGCRDFKSDEWTTADDSLAQVEVFAREGWTTQVDEVERLASWIEDRVITDRDLVSTFTATYDVSGCEVDIGRFLEGIPECMVEPVPQEVSKTGRVVRLVIANGVRAGVPTPLFTQRGAAIVALVDVLTRAQHGLELWVGSRTTAGHAYAVCVKRADEPVNTGLLMFATSHPAAHRVLGFQARKVLWPRKYHGTNVGGSDNFQPGDVPEAEGTTIFLPYLTAGEDWSPEASRRWIDQQLDTILGNE